MLAVLLLNEGKTYLDHRSTEKVSQVVAKGDDNFLPGMFGNFQIYNIYIKVPLYLYILLPLLYISAFSCPTIHITSHRQSSWAPKSRACLVPHASWAVTIRPWVSLLYNMGIPIKQPRNQGESIRGFESRGCLAGFLKVRWRITSNAWMFLGKISRWR